MKLIKENGFLLILMSIVIFQGIYWSTTRSIILDKSTTLHNAFLKDYYFDIHSTFYNFSLSIWISVFGHDLLGLRSLSVLAGVLSVVGIYHFSRVYFDKQTANLSALFLTFSATHVYYFQFGRSHALYIMLSIVSSFFYLRFINDQGWKYSALYVITSFLMVSTHIVGFALIATQWIHFFLFFRPEKKRLSYAKWISCQIVIALLYLPIFLKIINMFDLKKEIPIIYSWVSKPGMIDLLDSIVYLSGYGVLIILFVAIMGFAWKCVISKGKSDSILDNSVRSYLLLWIFMPMLSLYIYSQVYHPIFIARGFVISMIPIILLSSFYFLKFTYRRAQLIVICFALTLSVVQSVIKLNFKVESWKEMSNIINTIDSSAPVFINPSYAALPLAYYFKPTCFFDKNFNNCLHRNSIRAIGNKSDFPIEKKNFWFLGYNIDQKNNELYFEYLNVRPSKLEPSIYYQYIKN